MKKLSREQQLQLEDELLTVSDILNEIWDKYELQTGCLDVCITCGKNNSSTRSSITYPNEDETVLCSIENGQFIETSLGRFRLETQNVWRY